jgi:lipopolysaccharide transport system permease protein
MVATRTHSPTHFGGLLWTLVRTDFKSRYHGTAGGFLWALLKPVAMFLVLSGVFSFIFVSDPQYRLRLLIGLFLFDFFGEATKTGLLALHSKGFLLSKVHVPSWILVVASQANAMITLCIFFVMITSFQSLTTHPPTLVGVAFFVVYLVSFSLIIFGFSLASSALFLRYRDLNQVWDVVIQAGFFFAPVVYPLRVIPLKYHFAMYFWPPTAIIEFSRAVLVDGTIPTMRAHMFLLFETTVLLAVGAAFFRRLAPRAAEYL